MDTRNPAETEMLKLKKASCLAQALADVGRHEPVCKQLQDQRGRAFPSVVSYYCSFKQTWRLEMNNTIQASILMRIPPPLLFVGTFFLGLGMQKFLPVSFGAGSLVTMAHLAGIALIFSGLALALTAVGTFLLVRTTLIPFSTPSKLVIKGPFRFTRNPMYVSLVMVYIGVAGNLSQFWPLLLLPLPVLVIQYVVIPFEEARMSELFGSEYERYTSLVKRWL